MNNDMMNMGGATITTATSPDLQLCPASPDAQEIFRRTPLGTSDISAGNIQPITTQRNPRKKRTKMIRLHNRKPIAGVGSSIHSGMIHKKKPDPTAPKITRPCTECGKRFWSWKALFGHMRCHPERPWRGINPPRNGPNLHHKPPDPDHLTRVPTLEDEYVAACLLMLAKGPNIGSQDTLSIQIPDPETRFECSSCKKVFGTAQALGGHRASHKNVKGCFAITRNDTEELEEGEFVSHMVSGSGQQHRCSICSRIFSSGQALGGHKRCHWEKEDGVVPTASSSVPSQGHRPYRFDLNLPPQEDDSTCSISDLDLRLGL